jgi:hypothetical protein
MISDAAGISDTLDLAAGYRRGPVSTLHIRGSLHVVLTGPDGTVKYDEVLPNIVTQVGDQYYAERAALASGAPPKVTGMQLGTGSTTPTKTGAAAALGTLVAASLVAVAGDPTSGLQGSVRRLAYSASWAAGVATANNIQEVVLVNQSTGTQTAAPAASTIARALIAPIVNKGAQDTLAIVWNHDIGT